MDAWKISSVAPEGDARADVRRRSEPAALLRPSEADMDTLLALRMEQDLRDLDANLDRLEALGLITFGAANYPQLTARGTSLLRRWLS